jgi:hypothetical protein
VASAFLATMAVSRDASAQTVTLLESSITRTVSNRPAEQQRLWINRDDCLNDDAFNFPVNLSGFSAGITLEVWVSEGGVDCSELNNRQGTNQQCWNVASFTPATTLNATLTVKSRDIVGKHKIGGGPGSGVIEDCTVSTGTDAPLPLQIFFIIAQGTQALSTTAYTAVKYDLQGPIAATNVTAGAGESALVMSWTPSTSLDVREYRFYCDPPKTPITGPAPVEIPVACGGTGGTGGTTGVAGTGGDAGAGGDAGEAGAGGDAGEGGAGGDAGTAGATAGTGGSTTAGTGGSTTAGTGGSSCGEEEPEPTTCPTTVLVAGKLPDERYLCGGVTGITSTGGLIKGLENFTITSVGVAAVDAVGNVGPLATIVCKAPQPIDDFYRVYRDAGGRAGGGYCAVDNVGRRIPRTGVAAMTLALAAAFGRMLRRRAR